MTKMKAMAKASMSSARAGMGSSKRLEIPGNEMPGSAFPMPKLTGGMGGKGAFAFKGKK